MIQIYIYIFLICWYITEQSYIVNFIKDLEFKAQNKYLKAILTNMLCLKCLTFFVILISSFNLFYALLFSFIGAIYQKIK